MYRISKKADYAVFIMCQLAQREKGLLESSEAQTAQVPPMSAQELAEQGGLSKPLAANLLKALTRADLLESSRGSNGGYRLAQPTQNISLHHILEAVEGPMPLVACATDLDTKASEVDHGDCNLTHCCPSRSAMRIVHDRLRRLFADIKLAELATVNDNPLAALAVGGGTLLKNKR